MFGLTILCCVVRFSRRRGGHEMKTFAVGLICGLAVGIIDVTIGGNKFPTSLRAGLVCTVPAADLG